MTMVPRDAVPVEIGGHRLWLRYSFGAMAHLQSVLGLKSWAEVVDLIHTLEPHPEDRGDVQAWMQRVSPAHVEIVLWCGLVESMGEERAFPGPDALGRAITLRAFPGLLRLLATAISLQFNPPDDDEGGGDAPAHPPEPTARSA
jgi:hypothetical protein